MYSIFPIMLEQEKKLNFKADYEKSCFYETTVNSLLTIWKWKPVRKNITHCTVNEAKFLK